MVHTNQVTNLMDQMMKMKIFQTPEKLQLLKDDVTMPDPNVIMDVRHQILRDKFSAMGESTQTETKRLLAQEEATQLYMKKQQQFLKRELKKFEMELNKSRPKYLKSYTCSRRNLAPSDDKNFWETARNLKKKVIIENGTTHCSGRGKYIDPYRKNVVTDTGNGLPKVTDEKCLKTRICEVPHIGSIKVTIKDKTNVNTDEERLYILKKYFDILKQNAINGRSLQEIKIKIQLNMDTKIMRKYFDIWRTRVLETKEFIRKDEKEISEEGKIEMFINAITERQKDIMKSTNLKNRDVNLRVLKESNKTDVKNKGTLNRAIIESPAQNRLNAQKKIIEKQKAKLAEQSRIIEEFKLKEVQKQISKANRDTMRMAKETLTHFGQERRRPFIHLIQQNGYRDENIIEHKTTPDPPKFLLRMETRAEARRKRIKLVEDLRRQKLEEQQRKEEAAKMKEEQNHRRLQQEAVAEARKLRKIQEEIRRKAIERQKRLNHMADEFYRKYLLRRYIMEPFIIFINQARINMKKAINHYQEKLLSKTFTAWQAEAKSQCEIKIETALLFYNKNLKARILQQWKDTTKEVNLKYQVAIDFFDMKLSVKYLNSWVERVNEIKTEFKQKAKLADSTYEKKLKINYISKWKRYLDIAQDVKESEKRKGELRQLVQEVIPDFDPKRRGVNLED